MVTTAPYTSMIFTTMFLLLLRLLLPLFFFLFTLLGLSDRLFFLTLFSALLLNWLFKVPFSLLEWFFMLILSFWWLIGLMLLFPLLVLSIRFEIGLTFLILYSGVLLAAS